MLASSIHPETIAHRLRQHAAALDRAARFILGYEVGQDSYDEETWASFWPDGTRMTHCTEGDLDKLVQKKVRTLSPADILAKIEEVLHESWCVDAEEDAPITAEERLGMILGFALKALQEERLLVPQPGADVRSA